MTRLALLKHDLTLRGSLSNPRRVARRGKRPLGNGAVRLLIACSDAAQVTLLSVAWASVLAPDQIRRAAMLGMLVSVVALLVRRGLRSTTEPLRATPAGDAGRACLAVLAGCALPLLAGTLLSDSLPSHMWMLSILCWAASSAGVSLLLRIGPARLISERRLRPNIVVVGPQPQAGLLTSIMSRQGNCNVLAQFSPASPADMTQLEEIAWAGRLDRIVLAGITPQDAERICLAVGDSQAHICLGFDTLTYLSMNPDSSRSMPPPMLPLLPNPADNWRWVVKRGMDVALVLMALPLVMPVLAGAALLIRFESKGPILFRQWRFGLGSQPTEVLKFRTMYHEKQDITGEVRTLARDPRVTRVGRFLRRTSIDELPQLLNVLRGDMSLVGPRPHATHMKVEGNYYFEAVEGYRLRHRVKPGITGWAQVTGSRGEVSTIEKANQRIEKDLWYIRNWSLSLDVWILVRTILGGFVTFRAD